jgi:hypothetical protein
MTHLLPFHAACSITATMSRPPQHKQPSSPRVFRAKKQLYLTSALTNRHAAMNYETPPPPERHASEGHMTSFRTSYDLTISDPSSDETATVIVGEDQHTATFHFLKALLKTTSNFFAHALRHEWHAPSKSTIHLPEIPPALFDLYVRWLISGARILVDEDDWRTAYSEYLT